MSLENFFSQDTGVLTRSITSRPKPKRRSVSEVKITYKVFTENFGTNPLGERSAALQSANTAASRLILKRIRVVASGLALTSALFISAYSVFYSLAQSNAQLPRSESPAAGKTEPCQLSLSETPTDSRSKSSFGGVIVETGEIECGGQYFIVTQTAKADGRVLSVKKKRA